MSQDVLVSAKNLHRFFGSHRAVEGIDLQLRQGEVLGLLGPNGAGKSTTMQMLTGNLAPTSGEILINGIDLLDSPRKAKQHIGYLPEQPPVYRDMTVQEYLTYCANLRGVIAAEHKTAIEKAMLNCGLQDVAKRLIGNLSKGYQQRTGIAQAILHNPAVVILDEPTVGLDPVQINEIRKLIRQLGKDHSVILSTHILPEVQSVCDRVQIINQGKTVFADSLEGLEHRHAEPVLLVGFVQGGDALKLAAIDGVESVDEMGGGRFHLHYHDQTSIADEVCKLAFAEGWKLKELIPQATTLESIFMDLVHNEEKAA
jgi:ABC-2 type transport system ATP-binding protein